LTNVPAVSSIRFVRSIWRTVDRDLARAIAVLCLSVGVVGVSYGAVAVTAGFPLWLPVLTATLVLAGSSEFLFVGIIAGGGSPVAAVAAGLLVNARHLTYGLAIPDVIEPGWRRVAGTHLMNDEAVVVALAQDGLARQRAAYWAAGIGIAACWPGGALAGALLGRAVGSGGALGLDAVFPAATLALILPALRDGGTRRAALAGAAIALAAVPFLPAGLPELLGLGGLALAGRAA
jgi:4-azaleucine resistance transporter AzlC